ncbi:hypothetical protein [Glycomyces xiaoerkulensis]|uniref:hypothetical protein n=1 Tax=Glycomyces xiaoerkulensis TaxID=2038139 RepID=UPI000C266D2E|nr:hypothetical protein [Glycomyces xiaoerkulensis]
MNSSLTVTRPAYIRLVRASAWYDLAITTGFATPWTFALVHEVLSSMSEGLGLGAMPPLNPMTTLYATLMGSVVVVWSLLRIVRTQRVHGLFDGVTRMLFTAWMAYALVQGAPQIVWGFLVVEVAWGVLQLAPWLRARIAAGESA